MKRYDFNKNEYDDVKVICEHDGVIAYCNALAVNGLCNCNDCYCRGAVAVIATKNGRTVYLQLKD